MKTKTTIFAAVTFLSLSFIVSATEAPPWRVESLLDRENLWEATADNFIDKNMRSVFRWVSDEKDAARYPAYKNSPSALFLDMKVWEAIVRFEEGKISRIDVSLYNRGDAGEMTNEDAFQEKTEAAIKKLDEWTKDKGVLHPKQRLATGMKVEKKVWVKDDSLIVELKWSVSENVKTRDTDGDRKKIEFRAEYIQLSISRFDPKNDPRKISAIPPASKKTETASAKEIKTNVKKDDDGYVFIDGIPMVDQGQKGYCAVASAERVLRYYGTEVDQHVLAQLANTGAGGGTRPDEMLDALKKVGVKLGVKVRIHNESDINFYINLVKDYNKISKKMKGNEIRLGNMIVVDELYRSMKPDILKDARCEKNKGGYKNFVGDITKHIDAGIPLLWSVMLGIVKEEKRSSQTGGSHMRIISGYNRAKNEIIYTDSWGAGHERKTMPFDDAWTITTGLYSLDPRNRE